MVRFPVIIALFCRLALLASGKKAFVVPKRHAVVLSLPRGGAIGPLDPAIVARTTSGVAIVQGAACLLTPSQTSRAYGIKEDSQVIEFIEHLGAAMLGMGIMVYAMLINNCKYETAIACALIVCVCHLYKNAMNTPRIAKAAAYGFWAMLDSVIAYLGLNSDKYDFAGKLMKWFGYFIVVHFASIAIDPVGLGDFYGYTNMSAEGKAMWRSCSMWLVAFGVMFVALASGVEVTKALGYAWIVAAVNRFSFLFVTRENDELKLPSGPQYAWLVFHILVATTLVFQK
jgi:hypothetical protein